VVKHAQAGALPRTDRHTYRVESVASADAIRALLEPRRLYAAYAIGQLDPDLVSLVACWRAAAVDGAGEAVAVFSRGGLGDALFTMGESGALQALLALHPGPRQNYVTCEPHHLDVVSGRFYVASERPMMRMTVTRDTFVPADVPEAADVRYMGAGDARFLNRLYSSEGSPTYYSGGQIAQGCYYGVLVDGRLVAVAGTHVVSAHEGIAVVGNVFTHPRWRGLGYAKLATSCTTAALLQKCRDVVLTVDPQNTPAVRAYERLGYARGVRLIEAAVTRRDLLPFGSTLRRLRARIRAHEGGVEVVSV
jgi:GNAT superfamily N-acetyltransferase